METGVIQLRIFFSLVLVVLLSCRSHSPKHSTAGNISSRYGALVDSILHQGGQTYAEMETGGIKFNYIESDYFRQHLAELMTDAQTSLHHCRRMLQLNDSLPAIRIIYFASREKMRPFLQIAPKGIALPEAYTLLIATNDSTRAYHTHEMMHILSWHQFGGYAAAPGDWLQEGLSVYADNPCLNLQLHQVAAFLYHSRKMQPLDTLINNFRKLPDLNAYIQAGSVVQFYITQFGYVSFRRLWKEGAGRFNALTGKSLSAFEDAYHRFLLNAYPEVPAIDWAMLEKKGCG